MPRQLANAPHGHPPPPRISPPGHAARRIYGVLGGISPGYPPVAGRFHTCYSPVRRSPSPVASNRHAAPRLACVRPVASVHPEPGSNSPLLLSRSFFFFSESFLSERTRNALRVQPPMTTPKFIVYTFRLKIFDVDSVFLFLVSHCLLSIAIISMSFANRVSLFPRLRLQR